MAAFTDSMDTPNRQGMRGAGLWWCCKLYITGKWIYNNKTWKLAGKVYCIALYGRAFTSNPANAIDIREWWIHEGWSVREVLLCTSIIMKTSCTIVCICPRVASTSWESVQQRAPSFTLNCRALNKHRHGRWQRVLNALVTTGLTLEFIPRTFTAGLYSISRQ